MLRAPPAERRWAQLVRAPRQDPGHVDGHVPDADHDGRTGGERKAVARRVGVRAVPGHEVGGRVAARQILAGNAEPAVPGGPYAVHDRVIELQELLRPEPVRPDLHIADEVDPVVLQHGAEIVLQRLDLLVVGRDPVAHESVGAGEPVEHVDPHIGHPALLDEILRGVDPAGSRSDNGDAKHSCAPSRRGLQHRTAVRGWGDELTGCLGAVRRACREESRLFGWLRVNCARNYVSYQ